MKGKPRWAVSVRNDIEASDEWLTLLTRGERGGARGRSPASNGQDWRDPPCILQTFQSGSKGWPKPDIL